MTIEFEKVNNNLVLKYTPLNGTKWISEKLKKDKVLRIKETFFVEEKHLVELSSDDFDADDSAYFKLGELYEDYYRLDNKVLSIECKLYMHKDIRFTHKLFVADKNISIFRKINKLTSKDIYIGGSQDNNMPYDEFLDLIKYFPNSYELRKYSEARVSSIIKESLDIKTDKEVKYHKYLNKKIKQAKSGKLLDSINDVELKKYEFIYEKLNDMLNNENKYNENQWQNEIVKFICLLYPKYIKSFKEAEVWDEVKGKNRRLDFLLIDSTGHVDIIEIKKPSPTSLLKKRQHRDNYVPKADLSNTVMQVEKYIYHLNRWGSRGEKKLTEKYKKDLPKDLTIKITNPIGIIIMGRTPSRSDEIQDFEVIKRKYKNVMDLITYDDLLSRLSLIISALTPMR